jgi:hypothetical protein
MWTESVSKRAREIESVRKREREGERKGERDHVGTKARKRPKTAPGNARRETVCSKHVRSCLGALCLPGGGCHVLAADVPGLSRALPRSPRRFRAPC